MKDWIKTGIKKCFIKLMTLVPMRDDVILESHPDFTDNANAFYQYLLSIGFNKRHRIYWALHDKERELPELPYHVKTFYLDASGQSEMRRRFFALYRCRFILDSNTYIKKRRKKQVRIHLGHGMLIKITPDYHNKDKIGELDGYLTTAFFWNKIFENKIGVPKDSPLSLGYPRDDLLVNSAADSHESGDFIFWMPTYRQHRLHREDGLPQIFPFGMPEIQTQEQLERLDQLLGERGIRLYFRPHPVQELSLFRQEPRENIFIADDEFLRKKGMDLYELLGEAKALITDYSSVYYDFLLTERPIGLTIGDREQYFSKYDCPFDSLAGNVEGVKIESFEEVLAFVRNVADGTIDCEPLRELKKRYHDFTDGSACERLYKHMRHTYGFDKQKIG